MKPENDFESPLQSNNPYAVPTSPGSASEGFSGQFLEAEPYEKLTPLKTVWFHPRRTMRTFLAFNSSRGMFLIACLSGIARFLERSEENSLGEIHELSKILLLAAAIGPIVGLLGVYFGAALLRMSGRILGGQAASPELRTAVAWGGLPVTACILLWIPKLLLVGDAAFKKGALLSILDNPISTLVYRIDFALGILMSVWAVFLSCNMVAEAQRFRSAWMGFVNYVLVFILLIGIILLLLVAVFLVVAIVRMPS